MKDNKTDSKKTSAIIKAGGQRTPSKLHSIDLPDRHRFPIREMPPFVDKGNIVDTRPDYFMPKMNDLYDGSIDGAIFNPYIEANNNENKTEISCDKIEDNAIASNGEIFQLKGRTIYVYAIKAEISTFSIKTSIPGLNKHNDWCAMCFYDKEFANLVDFGANNISDATKEMVKYFWHNFGSVTYQKVAESNHGFFIVPRELFCNDDDYVYLCICSNTITPNVVFYEFPQNKPFFYDLPVATSIISKQRICDSKLLLGKVRIRNPEMKDVDGKFIWQQKENRIIKMPTDYTHVEVMTDSYVFKTKDKAYSCVKVGVDVFYRSETEDKSGSIDAFVWQSGNADDRINRAMIATDTEPDVYNKYSHIFNVLSLQTIYHSYASIRKITSDNAARYVVRTLAKQPEGLRSISIEGHLEFLMGGALYHASSIITSEKDKKTPSAENKKLIESLFETNGNHLFFDNPVYYEHENNTAVTYLQTGLGIPNNSHGCAQIKELLSNLFETIKKYSLSVDYCYCDIEGINNEARYIKSSRDISQNNKDEVEVEYEKVLLDEIKQRKSIAFQFANRGFDYSTDSEYSVLNNMDKSNSVQSSYGLNVSQSYSKRRNLNIWDAVMKEYSNSLFYEYVIKPVLDVFPKAKCSAYGHCAAKGYINQADRYETYLGGSVFLNPQMYSCVNLYGNYHSENYKKLCMDNWKMTPNHKTTYSILIDHINRLRTACFSSNRKITAFICSKQAWTSSEFPINSENKDAEQYYKEYLYHIFLCNPDKLIAYFNKDCIAQANPDNTMIYNYYRDSFSVLQIVLEELNNLFGNEKRISRLENLAVATDPFVVSGLQVGKKAIWRITFDLFNKNYFKDGKVHQFDIGRNYVGFSFVNVKTGKTMKSVKFPGGKIINTIDNRGCWVETKVGVEPVYGCSADYYEQTPALLISKDQISQLDNNTGTIKFNEYKTHTVFGECPKVHTWEMKFRIVGGIQSEIALLYGSNLYSNNSKTLGVTIDSEKKIHFIFQGKNVKTISIPNITEGICTLRFTITFSSKITADTVTAFAKYNLFFQKQNSSTATPMGSFSANVEYVRVKNSQYEYFESAVNLIQTKTESIKIEEFKIFLSGHQEKVELFRESDGVNITRTNKKMSILKCIDDDPYPQDNYAAKFSWINACDRKIQYHLRFFNNIRLRPVSNTIILEKKIVAEKNSEGYEIIALPATTSKNITVEISSDAGSEGTVGGPFIR